MSNVNYYGLALGLLLWGTIATAVQASRPLPEPGRKKNTWYAASASFRSVYTQLLHRAHRLCPETYTVYVRLSVMLRQEWDPLHHKVHLQFARSFDFKFVSVLTSQHQRYRMLYNTSGGPRKDLRLEFICSQNKGYTVPITHRNVHQDRRSNGGRIPVAEKKACSPNYLSLEGQLKQHASLWWTEPGT